MRIKGFRAWRPTPERADRVASVPYDTVDREEARALAQGNPDSFLHVVRPDIDLPDDTDSHAEPVYEQARRAFKAFQEQGILQQEDEEALYIYRIRAGERQQTGLVAVCHTQDYRDDIILKHEKTRPDKEDDRTRLIKDLRAQTGPVFLTYRDSAAVDACVAAETVSEPLLSAAGEDGTRHDVWRVQASDALVGAFQHIPVGYIADGHHRAAAASRAACELAEANPTHDGSEAYNWFLGVLFPESQLHILAYNRCVTDLNGLSPNAFLDALRERVDVTEAAPAVPVAPHQVSVYVDGRWWGLHWEVPEGADPVARLDASVLQERVLNPVLGIGDPRTDTRISFVGGIRGTEALEHRVASGADAVAFSMYPVSVGEMMDIADAGQIMPPKSTWFEPKLRSGLLVHAF